MGRWVIRQRIHSWKRDVGETNDPLPTSLSLSRFVRFHRSSVTSERSEGGTRVNERGKGNEGTGCYNHVPVILMLYPLVIESMSL